MSYSSMRIAEYFDRLADGEWQRYDQSALGQVHLHIHEHYLRRYIAPGSRVLEIGAGPGRFTESLHRLNCQIVVGDISPVQLLLNRDYGQSRGFGASVEARLEFELRACSQQGFVDGGTHLIAVAKLAA